MSDNLNKIDSSKKAPNVFMSVSDGTGSSATTSTVGPGIAAVVSNIPYIPPAPPPPPDANFNATSFEGPFPLTVNFEDTSLNSPTAWAWDFDNDGIYDSTEQNPAFTYSEPGTYSVKLTAISPYGSNTIIKHGYINVTDAPTVTPTTWYSITSDVGGWENSDEYGSSVAYDSTGNLYTLGSNGWYGVPFLVKHNSLGQVIWSKEFVDSENLYKYGDAISVDANDNIYVTVSVDDMYVSSIVIKLDSTGNIIWQKEIINSLGDYNTYAIVKLRVDADNNIYGLLYRHGQKKVSVLKMSQAGDIIWQRQVENIIPQYPSQTLSGIYPIGLELDSTGNVYALYRQDYTLSATLPYTPRKTAVIVKLDTNGNTVWANEYYLTTAFEYRPNSMSIYNGEICIAGQTSKGNPINKHGIGILYIDTETGILADNKCYDFINGTASSLRPVYGLVTDNNGNRYFSGTGRILSGTSTNSSMFIFKLDANKNMVWSSTADSLGSLESQMYIWSADTSAIDPTNTRVAVVIYAAVDADVDWQSDCVTFQLDTEGTENGTYHIYTFSDNPYLTDDFQEFSQRSILGMTTDPGLQTYNGSLEDIEGSSVNNFFGIDPPSNPI